MSNEVFTIDRIKEIVKPIALKSVSYTHLTLPTTERV